MDRNQQDKILAFHMVLDKQNSGLYNYVVVNMRLLSAVITTNQNLYYFSYKPAPLVL